MTPKRLLDSRVRASRPQVPPFMLMGKVVEHAPTEQLFVTPASKGTSDYIEEWITKDR